MKWKLSIWLTVAVILVSGLAMGYFATRGNITSNVILKTEETELANDACEYLAGEPQAQEDVLRYGSYTHAQKPVLVNVQVDVGNGDRDWVYRILGEIEKRGWSITVYFTGDFAEKHPEVVKDIHDRRHQIGVGGWESGEDLTLLDYREQLNLINKSFTAVRKAINNFYYAYIADFKPQGLRQNEDTFKALQELKVRSNAGFLASETKTHPYHTDYGFVAIPVATIKEGSEDIPLVDEVIFDTGASPKDYLGYLTKRYDESLVTKEPFTVVVHASVIGSDEERLEVFASFLDYVQGNNGMVVMTDFMTTKANPYISDLMIYGPDVAKAGSSVNLRIEYSAHCDCPNYFVKLYGKYANQWFWKLRSKHVKYGAPIDRHSFSRNIKIPFSFLPNYYIVRGVGRACHGTCWPWSYGYETKYDKWIKTYCIEDWDELLEMGYAALSIIKSCSPCIGPCGGICAAAFAAPPESLVLLGACAYCLASNPACAECAKDAIDMIKLIIKKIRDCSSWGGSSSQSSSVFGALSTGTAEFTDSYSEYLVDKDNDGYYDYLAIGVGVNNTEPGDYSVIGVLSRDDFLVFALNESYLDNGLQTVELPFGGSYIYENKTNGRFNLSYLFIFDGEGNLTDNRSNAYTTSEYDYSIFQPVGGIEGFVKDYNENPVPRVFVSATPENILFWDDFDDNYLDANNWTMNIDDAGITIAETGGEIRISGITADNVNQWDILETKERFDESIAVEIDVKLRSGALWGETGFLSLGIFGEDGKWVRIMANSDVYSLTGDLGYGHTEHPGVIEFFYDEDVNYHKWRLEYDKSGQRISGYIDGNLISDWDGVNLGNFTIRIFHEDFEQGTDTDFRIDDFIIRKPGGENEYYYDITDGNGSYVLPRLEEGVYMVEAEVISDNNLLSDSVITNLGADETKIINFTLKEGGTVEGYIKDYNGIPVSDAMVEIFETSGTGYETAVSDTNGFYNLTGLGTGDYEINVIPADPNLFETFGWVFVSEGETAAMNFTLAQAGSITGKVTDINGTPVTNVYMFLGGYEMPRHSVDENGSYVIPGLYAGTYTVNTDAFETEFLDDSKTVDVTLGQTTSADFVLQKGRTLVKISGYMFNTTGDALSNVPVWLENVQNGMGWVNTTNENGYFEFTNISSGWYDIEINGEWPRLLEYTSVELDDENTVNLTQDLEMNFTLWRIDIVDMTTDSPSYINGDIIEVNITARNNDVYDLINWGAVAGLEYENEEYEELDFNVVAPINLSAGETNSFIIPLTIPENNTHPELDLWGGVGNGNFTVNSSMGPLNALTYQEVWGRMIQVDTEVNRSLISGYVFNSSGNPLANVPVELEDEGWTMWLEDTTDAEGYFEFTNLEEGLYELDINDEDGILEDYTTIAFEVFDDKNMMINLTDDLEINVTLLKIDARLELNASKFENGDTIKANVTVTNNEAFNLTNWGAVFGVNFENETHYEELYFNLTPTSLLAEKTKSFVFTYKIPENNTYDKLYLFGGTGNDNWDVVSSLGNRTALIYKVDVKEIYLGALPGDVNGDCTVNIFDLAHVGLCYGKEPEGFCEPADIHPPPDGDGKINIFDLATVGLNYGQECA